MSEEVAGCVWCQMTGGSVPAWFILTGFTRALVWVESSHTIGVASKLIPKIQNVPFGWDERSSVLLTLNSSGASLFRRSDNTKLFLLYCGFFTFLSLQWVVGEL